MRRVALWSCLLGIALTPAASADEPPPSEQAVAPTAFNQEGPEPQPPWGVGTGYSKWIPAADIVLFDLALNLVNREFYDAPEDFRSNWNTFRENLTGRWVYDNDDFEVNQFGHPYQGSMYHGFARATGHDYWGAMGYAFGGSVLWELAGETTRPSINDQWATGIGGSFLGEPLFRLASLVLETSDGPPDAWREVAAALVSPATGFNRWNHGRRFDGVFASRDPAVYTRLQLGANVRSSVRSDVNLASDPTLPAVPQSYREGEAIADFTVSYGLPGKPGYRYERPFDYFSLQFTAATGNALENVIARGLLYGAPYGDGEHYRGIWGVYGTYDYIAPQIFRVSTTGFALGTTGQWWAAQDVALQTEVLAGAGYGSAGVIDAGSRNYHNGVTPQGMLALRLLFGDRALFEITARDYYVSDVASEEAGGSENIARGDATLSVRVRGLHGLTVRYTTTHRDARYARLDDTRQTVGVVSVGYTYLGHPWFGAVDWRPDATRKTLPD